MFNAFLCEKLAIKAIRPIDMNIAAIVGPRIKLDKGFRLSYVLSMGDSTAALVQFTLRQHNAATSGVSKDLPVSNQYFVKAGAATVFTKVEPTVAAALYDVSSTFAADGGILVLEVLAEDLDQDLDFAWVSLDAADSAAAKILTVVPVLHELKQRPAYSIPI